jgi:hypothetical protein
MEPVRRAEQVFFPLDEELQLLCGRLTPRQHEHLVHLAAWMPFDRVAQMLECLLGIQVSEATVRRLTEEAGARMQEVQTAQSQQPEAEEKPTSVPQQQVVSSDGAYVHLVSGDWAEVRTLAIGEVERSSVNSCKKKKKTQADEAEAQVKVSQISYFSRMTAAQTFEQLAEVEVRRRGVRHAVSVAAVMDGAAWLQGFIDVHRPDAVRILDFSHAASYISDIQEAVRARGYHLPAGWYEGVLHRLKHEGPDRILKHLEWLAQRCHDPEVDKQWRYLSARKQQMQYPTYQQAGWPIGSGMVESAHKVVWQTRLKGAGMRWAPAHVNPMLAVRTSVCNERWDEAWQQGNEQHHRLRQLKRQQKAHPRLQALLSDCLLSLLRLRPPTPKPTPPVTPSVPRLQEPPATLPGSSRPSAHHPWKRGPACRPSLLAKK